MNQVRQQGDCEVIILEIRSSSQTTRLIHYTLTFLSMQLKNKKLHAFNSKQ